MSVTLWYEPIEKVLQAASEAAGNGEVLDLGGKYSTVVIQVVGTMTNSAIHYEGSIDGKTFVALVGINQASGAVGVNTGAAAGIFTVPVVGIKKFRARRHGSGTAAVTVTAIATAAPAVQVTAVQ